MSDLMVVVTENAVPSLRGRLTLWLVEIRAGVYVGMYSAKVRDYIWDIIEQEIKRKRANGNAIMVWKDRTDAGYSVRTCGKASWEPSDFDGITLMKYMGNDEHA